MFASLFKPLLQALRANLIPAGLLWVAGASVVWGYYRVEAVQACLNALWSFRSSVGIIFPIVSTAFAGAIIPAVLQLLLKPTLRRESLRLLPWLTLLWAWKGVEVDLFYKLQARLWGTSIEPGVIVGKVLVDMLIYNPLLGALLPAIYYRWIQRTSKAEPLFPKHWYRRLVLPFLVVTWAVWLPSVAMIYLMPTPLQLPLQNLVLVFFCLLVLIVTKPEPVATAGLQEQP